MKPATIFVLISLALASLACTITIPTPKTVETVEPQTFTINEAAPKDNQTTRVTINMGAGKLEMTSGGKGLIEGTVRYNLPLWEPKVERSGDTLTLSQEVKLENQIPTRNLINEWKLKLGNSPMDLTLNAGAYEGKLDLGGVPLTRLSISDGASSADVDFSKPNPEKMTLFIYKTGASTIKLTNLADANFSEMVFEGGAGTYTLDFGGTLKQDTRVKVSAGVSTLKIVVPADANCEVTLSGGLNSVDTTGEWSLSGKTYTSGGSGKKITISLDMGVGSLELVRK